MDATESPYKCPCDHREYSNTEKQSAKRKDGTTYECPCQNGPHDDFAPPHVFEVAVIGAILFALTSTIMTLIIGFVFSFFNEMREVDEKTGTTVMQRLGPMFGAYWAMSSVIIATTGLFYSLWLWDRSRVLGNFDRMEKDEESQVTAKLRTWRSFESLAVTALSIILTVVPVVLYFFLVGSGQDSQDDNITALLCMTVYTMFMAVGTVSRVLCHCGCAPSESINSLSCRMHRFLARDLPMGKERAKFLEVLDAVISNIVDSIGELKTMELARYMHISSKEGEHEACQNLTAKEEDHYTTLGKLMAARFDVLQDSKRRTNEIEEGVEKWEAEKYLAEEKLSVHAICRKVAKYRLLADIGYDHQEMEAMLSRDMSKESGSVEMASTSQLEEDVELSNDEKIAVMG